MRLFVLIVVALCAVPCVAQDRVFHASSIDAEQDMRLDSVEQRVATLEAVPVNQPPKPQARPKQTYVPANMVSKPSASKPAASKPYAVITIESIPGCPPCERWKSKEARELRAQGWTVVETSLTSSGSAPFFRICIGDKCYSHSGFMSHGALRAIVDRARGSRQSAKVAQSVQSSRYTTEELRALIQQARPGGWRGPVYADVAPSYAKQHLVEPKHGFTREQVAGLTTSEALILHDLAPTHGNQIFPTRQISR